MLWGDKIGLPRRLPRTRVPLVPLPHLETQLEGMICVTLMLFVILNAYAHVHFRSGYTCTTLIHASRVPEFFFFCRAAKAVQGCVGHATIGVFHSDEPGKLLRAY